jgi:hypothetical protein
MPSDDTCTVHGKPAQWSYCGGYWFCEGAYDGDDERECAVAWSDVEEELGGEG